jgi:hypothetical protein
MSVRECNRVSNEAVLTPPRCITLAVRHLVSCDDSTVYSQGGELSIRVPFFGSAVLAVVSRTEWGRLCAELLSSLSNPTGRVLEQLPTGAVSRPRRLRRYPVRE